MTTIPVPAQALIASLRKLQTAAIGPMPVYTPLLVPPHVVYVDSAIHVSGEHEHGQMWLDYYGEYRGGYPWINPVLEQWAKAHNGYWEWDNPASISFYPK